MTTVSVGNVFKQERALVRVDPLARKLGSLVAGDDVHTVRLDTRDRVTTRVKLRVHRRTLRGRAHAVFVVFTYEYAREVPELGLNSWEISD